MLSAEDLGRIAEGINPKAKTGTMDHDVLTNTLRNAQKKAVMDISEDSMRTIAKQGQVARMLGETPQGIAISEEQFGPNHEITRMARSQREIALAQPSKLQAQFDSQEVKDAQETLKDEFNQADRDVETVIDPGSTGFLGLGGVDEKARRGAQGRIDRRGAAEETLRRLGVRAETTPTANIAQSLQDQPTAEPAPAARPDQKGRNSPTAKVTEVINEMNFGPEIQSADDVPAELRALILGEVTGKKVSLTKAVMDRLLNRRIKAQKTRREARARGQALQDNPAPPASPIRNLPQS